MNEHHYPFTIFKSHIILCIYFSSMYSVMFHVGIMNIHNVLTLKIGATSMAYLFGTILCYKHFI